MRNIATSFAEVSGAACVTAGAFVWNLGLGLVTLGGFLLAFSRAAVRA